MDLDRTKLAAAIRQIGIQMEHRANRVMAGRALTAAQGHVLLYILDHARTGISLTQIHAAFGHSKAALSASLKQLREKGFVRTEPCVQDDRRKLIFVTPRGREVKRFLDQSFQEACDQLYEGFSQAELWELDRLQRKMLDNLARAGAARPLERDPILKEVPKQ